MSVSWSSYKSIVEDASVSALIDQYRQRLKRFDEAWSGLTWLLARSAGSSGLQKEADGKLFHLHAYAANTLAGTPRIVVIFTTTESEVVIHGIRATQQ